MFLATLLLAGGWGVPAAAEETPSVILEQRYGELPGRFAGALRDGRRKRADRVLGEVRANHGARGLADFLLNVVQAWPGLRDDLETWLAGHGAERQFAWYQVLRSLDGEHTMDAALVWLDMAAERGHAPAQAELGRLYLFGFERDGRPERNAALGLRWMRLAAEAGDPGARRDLAYAYRHGEGVPVDLRQAFELLTALHREGHAPAAGDLADFYLEGTAFITRDLARGMRLLEEAMDGGDAYAAWRLHSLYLRENSADGRRRAMDALQEAANGGVIPALVELARWHVYGSLREADPDKALALVDAALRRVDEDGYADAGRRFYLRQVYQVAADAALLAGDYRYLRRVLNQLADVIEGDGNLPAQVRIEDYSRIAAYFGAMGLPGAALEISSRVLAWPETAADVNRVNRIALRVQRALNLERLGQHAEASAQFAAIDASEVPGKDDEPMIAAFLRLAGAAVAAHDGRHRAARRDFAAAADGFAGALGEHNPYSHLAHVGAARSWLRGGNTDKADAAYAAAMDSLSGERFNDFPWSVAGAAEAAGAFLAAGKTERALHWSRRAATLLGQRSARLRAGGHAALPGEKRLARDTVHLHGRILLGDRSSVDGAAGLPLFDELFGLAQHQADLTASLPIAGMRVGRPVEGLQPVDHRSEIDRLRFRIERLRRDYLQARARGRSPGETALRARALEDLVASLEGLERAQRESVNSVPSTVTAGMVQEQLRDGHVLVRFLVAREGTLAWVARRDDARLFRLDATLGDVKPLVASIRRSLDPYAYGFSVAPFPDRAARSLYELLLEPLEDSIAGAERLVVIARGPLADLPLALLQKPAEGDAPGGHRWLIESHELAYVPGVREYVAPGWARPADNSGFLGVADARFGTAAEPPPTLEARRFFTPRGAVDTQQLRRLPPLPDTREEVRHLGRPPGKQTRLVLGAAATEAALGADVLGERSYLLFATHGLVAGRLDGRVEPGLALTPPAIPRPADDGLLRASEIARLRMAADRVVLSACNTVSSPVSGDGEGLSTLVEAFLRGGARRVIASHWPVAPAAHELVGELLDPATPATDLPGVLRRNMLAMMREGGVEQHPYFWAPLSYFGP